MYTLGNLYVDIYHGIYVLNHIVHVSKLPIYHAYSRKMKNKLKVGNDMENEASLKLGDKICKILKVATEG